jgi:hypothetical protein
MASCTERVVNSSTGTSIFGGVLEDWSLRITNVAAMMPNVATQKHRNS